jgi:hypothetical protein
VTGVLAALRPPDIWDTPAPTLREEVRRAMEGSHLPANPAWRAAEVARTVASTGVNALLLLLVHVNRSAARQAVIVLVVAVTAAVVSVLT